METPTPKDIEKKDVNKVELLLRRIGILLFPDIKFKINVVDDKEINEMDMTLVQCSRCERRQLIFLGYIKTDLFFKCLKCDQDMIFNYDYLFY